MLSVFTKRQKRYIIKCSLGTNQTTDSYAEAMEWLSKCGDHWAYIAEFSNTTGKFRVVASRCVPPRPEPLHVRVKYNTKLRAAIARCRHLLTCLRSSTS
jgi:hypothetical protein